MPCFKHLLILLALAATACTTETTSNPARTATEELLISTAADRASANLITQLPADSKIFLDTSNFEGTDSKYAVAAIRSSLFKQGVKLVDAKKDADIVVEVRAGALSLNNKTFLFGIPTVSLPVPFASSPLSLPEIALYKSADQKGIAKFAITSYDAKSGLLIHAGDPQFGFSHNKAHTVLILISWSHNDSLPDEDMLPSVTADQAASPADVKTAP